MGPRTDTVFAPLWGARNSETGGVALAVGHPGPSGWAQQFDRIEAGFVGHLGAAWHPVAEIDVRQRSLHRLLDMIEDDEGAQAAPVQARLEEAVDQRQP